MNSLDEFFDLIESKLKSDKFKDCNYPIYRGHSSESYELLPTLHRECLRLQKDIWKTENQLFYEFRSLAGSKINFSSSWDILFLMRHEGIPTRLLDWTENIGTALYFALSATHLSNPHIWILDPYQLNKNRGGVDVGLLTPGEDLPDYAEAYAKYTFIPSNEIDERPQAIYPNRSNDRLLAQKGLFTIHGKNISKMEDTCAECLEKIDIPEVLIPKLKSMLKYFGLNSFSVYPDIKGLCQYMNETYGFS